MSETVAEHRRQSPQAVTCAVITVSDTRTLETDRGGPLVVEMLEAAGHRCVSRQIVPDDAAFMRAIVQGLAGRGDIDAILMTGGTGIAERDQTFETISALLTKSMPGYGELFRMLSYQEIGPAAMLSRAIGGLCGRTLVLTMPGSPAAVRLAMVGRWISDAQRWPRPLWPAQGRRLLDMPFNDLRRTQPCG
jgi:molybdenum cofactor biosynthesis protein B